MIRHESVITALIGAALGLPLGIFLAALVTRALADKGVAFASPARLLAASRSPRSSPASWRRSSPPGGPRA